MNLKAILAGAVSGFVSALVVDINAWSKADAGTPFNWQLAVKRWIAGATTGATTAAGLSAAIGN